MTTICQLHNATKEAQAHSTGSQVLQNTPRVPRALQGALLCSCLREFCNTLGQLASLLAKSAADSLIVCRWCWTAALCTHCCKPSELNVLLPQLSLTVWPHDVVSAIPLVLKCNIFCCCSLKEATDLIAGLLGGQVRLFTTRCAMHELKTLGKDYAGVLKLHHLVSSAGILLGLH